MPMPEHIADKGVVKRYDAKLFGNEQHLYRDEQHKPPETLYAQYKITKTISHGSDI
jgi:hypothetical protein